jgi:hypothetical protein
MDLATATVDKFPKFQQRCICGCRHFYSRESMAATDELEIVHAGMAAIIVRTNLNVRQSCLQACLYPLLFTTRPLHTRTMPTRRTVMHAIWEGALWPTER